MTARLFIFSLLTALVLSHGGIRSPDSEIVYLSAESLAHRGTFALEHGCAKKDHGIARGVDGRLYSWFGPAQEIAWVPFVWLADAVGSYTDLAALGKNAPFNFYHANGLLQMWDGAPRQDPEGDARRWIASPLNALLHAATVVILYLVLQRLTRRDHAALLAAILFGWCSLALPYSGDALSETLGTFFVVLALHALAPREPGVALRERFVLLAGHWTGLAVATHVTAILFVPFFALLTQVHRRSFRLLLFHGIGLAVPLALLALHNWNRFGIPWETGRSVVATVLDEAQGTVAPWRGMWGLLFGGASGLFVLCPIVLLGFLGWRAWKKEAPLWAWTLLAAFLLRWVFISTRREWHGGFGLGPRYLILTIPLFLIPAAYWLREQLDAGRVRRIRLAGIAAALACAGQLYLCIGDYASHFHATNFAYFQRGDNPFFKNRVYLDWKAGPYGNIYEPQLGHGGLRGPWMLRGLPLTNLELWLCVSLIAAPLIFLTFRRAATFTASGNSPPENFQ